MTDQSSTARPYPKSHLLAASGAAALLSLALLVFPSREVEANKNLLDLQINATSALESVQDGQHANQNVTADSPFAQIPQPTDATTSADSSSVTDPLHKEITVANGDTLSTIFSKAGLSASTMHQVLASAKESKQLTRLKIGQVLTFQLTESGELESLHTRLSDLESVTLSKQDNGYKYERDLITPQVDTRYTRGVIDSSLFLAAKRAGLSHAMTMDLANVFAYDIDFALDIRKGDEFEIIYEAKVVDSKVVGYGDILAARFVNKGKTYSAIRYTTRQGQSSYYGADGNSLRKAFIRTPVDFARISSRFSNGRKHPILNKIRAHKGVDYAAPHGTPIKAAGDGKVRLAGRKGGYGNTVIIQHGQSYQTLYGHMQGFAKGIRNGANVKQGQVIGYIGTTGLSTGPHLHYEFLVNGQHVDPLSQKLAMADPIPANEKARFQQFSRPLLARLDQERSTLLAMNHSEN
jgi:murein DD-endopeptidase MepM/ murein hydrolase activator NlpD